MFRENDTNLNPGATPERVLALCKAASLGNYNRQTLFDMTYLLFSDINNPPDEWGRTISVACDDLGFLVIENGNYRLNVENNTISTIDNFRRAVAKRVFANPETMFFRMSKWYMSQDYAVFSLRNWEDKAVQASNDGIGTIRENDFLGWRFWAAFLGLGYINGATLIPNMYVRIKDVIHDEYANNFKYGESIPAKTFFEWLLTKVPEAKTGSDSLCMGLSNGLRTMRDLGEIELLSERDAIRVPLYPIDEDKTNSVSHVIVKKVN